MRGASSPLLKQPPRLVDMKGVIDGSSWFTVRKKAMFRHVMLILSLYTLLAIVAVQAGGGLETYETKRAETKRRTAAMQAGSGAIYGANN